jgi:hypothetical protein
MYVHGQRSDSVQSVQQADDSKYGGTATESIIAVAVYQRMCMTTNEIKLNNIMHLEAPRTAPIQ